MNINTHNTGARGFTLIELLVVIAIIGILSAVVLTSLNSARLKARDARRISDIKQIQLALELAYDTNGSYPAAPLTTVNLPSMSAIPTDPTDNSAFGYAQLSSGASYILGASLEADNGVLDSDNDTAQAFTLRGVATNCNASDAAAPFVFCVVP